MQQFLGRLGGLVRWRGLEQRQRRELPFRLWRGRIGICRGGDGRSGDIIRRAGHRFLCRTRPPRAGEKARQQRRARGFLCRYWQTVIMGDGNDGPGIVCVGILMPRHLVRYRRGTIHEQGLGNFLVHARRVHPAGLQRNLCGLAPLHLASTQCWPLCFRLCGGRGHVLLSRRPDRLRLGHGHHGRTGRCMPRGRYRVRPRFMARIHEWRVEGRRIPRRPSPTGIRGRIRHGPCLRPFPRYPAQPYGQGHGLAQQDPDPATNAPPFRQGQGKGQQQQQPPQNQPQQPDNKRPAPPDENGGGLNGHMRHRQTDRTTRPGLRWP